MSKRTLIKNAFIVNQGQINKADILIEDKYIIDISLEIHINNDNNTNIIDATGLFVFPGVIDSHVHFREPGLTHKADIYHESKSAVAGGITSYFEMPNTNPPTTNIEALNNKLEIASKNSFANYSFYLGLTNDNYQTILNTPINSICGIKLFLGSSTGNLLVDDQNIIEKIFKNSKHIISVHCEDDNIIKSQLEYYLKKLNNDIPISYHSKIRNEKACFSSSKFAIELAKKNNTRLHLLHLSTKEELSLLDNNINLEDKKITAEACVHHLWFSADDYEKYGSLIKWNPSIKEKKHREAIRKGIINNTIDIVSTDHAPHLFEEKTNKTYINTPSGSPIIQFSLQIMLELYHKGIIPIEKIAELMCHNQARIFKIYKRGFIKKGYFADLTIVDINKKYVVSKDKIISKCKWSPVEGTTFKSSILKTIVNGEVVFDNGIFNESYRAEKIIFNR